MNKKIARISIVGIAVFATCAIGIRLFNSSEEEVFPNKEDVNYFFGYYREDIVDNWSDVSVDSSDHQFKMTYTLSRATRNPFTASFIATKLDSGGLAKFHDHNSVRIDLKSNLGMRFPVMFTFDYEKGATKKNGKPFPMVTMEKFIDYTGPGEYIIPLHEFRIPDWWYRVHRLHKDEVDRGKVTHVRSVILGSCTILKEKLQDTVEIENITFYTDNSDWYKKLSVIISVVTIFAFLFVLGRGGKKKD